MRMRCTEVRFGNKASLFYRMSANITLSNVPRHKLGAVFFRKSTVFNIEVLLVSKYDVWVWGLG